MWPTTWPARSARSEEGALRVVVDTNVWVSGLILPESVPGRVLAAVRRHEVEAVASWELAEEIAAVLRRPALARRYRIAEDDVRDVLLLLGPSLPRVEVETRLRHQHDAPVVASALAAGAGAIVTGDADLLGDAELRTWLRRRGVAVLTPRELLDDLER